jgi:hypothetical protein
VTVERRAPPGAVLGALLIFLGLAFLAMRYLDMFEGMAVWPWLIIAPGAVMFVLGLFLPNTGMLIGGSVVATIGLILTWQNTTGLWASWAWIWTLIPTASGIGSFLGGLRTGSRSMRDAGLWQILIGLALLAAFYLFFEQIIGLSEGQVPLPEWTMPVVLVLLGVLVLLRAFFGPREPEQPA